MYLTTDCKIQSSKQEQGFDSFFIADCQLEPGIELSTPSCLQKGTPNETVGMSGKTLKRRNTKTSSLGRCINEDFTSKFVAIKAFFKNEICELKQKIESLKQRVYSGENFPVTKIKIIYLKI